MPSKSSGPAVVREASQRTSGLVEVRTSTETSSPEQANPHLELVANAVSDDPFDLGKLRVSQEFLETTGVKKLLTTVPVRRPGPQEFFRVRPSREYREVFAFLELKEDRETYLVNLNEVPELQPECYLATLFTVINRSGVLFMWPVRVPAADGRKALDWHTSAAEAAKMAMTRWVKMKSNKDLGAYEIFEAESPIPDPQWPDLTFEAVYRIAFKDGPITSRDHPAVRRLRGA